MSSDPIIVDSAADREAHLWQLVESLQKEKEGLLRMLDRLINSVPMSSVDTQTIEFPTPPMGPPKGQFTSIASLKHKHELEARERAAKLRRESSNGTP